MITCRIMAVQQYIRRFDIAVNHTLPVGIVNSKTDRCEKMNELSRGWKFSPGRCTSDIIFQGPTLDIVHHHIRHRRPRFRGMGYLEVMNLYDVRMMKGSNKLCFAL